ncbi:MAG: phage tail assembly chaperone [bacterium]|nr:phage tail assembly chaperone [bacterium]
MFAAIQNEKIIYCQSNELLCEAYARGFQSIDELREWEAGLPQDNRGCPVLPEAPFRIQRLEGALLEEYQALEREGYRAGEIRFVDVPPATPDSEDSEEIADEFEASDTGRDSNTAPGALSDSGAPHRRLVPDETALERRRLRQVWDGVRVRRNELLDQSDKYMMPDYPIDDVTREAWRGYREALRNLTQNAKDPATVEWPRPPS